MGSYSIRCPHCMKLRQWEGDSSSPPPCPHCQKQKKAKVRDVQEALDLAERIQDMAADLPGEGLDFGISVTEKAADIANNIETHNRVTDGQFSALENMLEGVQRWFHD